LAQTRRGFTRDVVFDFIQQITHCQFGGDFGDGKAGRLGSEREERLTRGFISMMTMRPLSGLTANWMFEPPVSTPISRMTANERRA